MCFLQVVQVSSHTPDVVTSSLFGAFSFFLLDRRVPAPTALGHNCSQITFMPQMGKLRPNELPSFCGGVCSRKQ